MPDAPIEPGDPRPYPPDLEARVAMLEQLARSTAAAIDRIDRRLEAFDHRFEVFDHRFETFGQRFEMFGQRFEMLDRRLDSFERRLEAMDARHHADLRWLVMIILSGWAGLLGVMAHGFRWL